MKDRVADYGQSWSTIHHVPAVNFERVLSEARANYVMGLTATPKRKDGHDPISPCNAAHPARSMPGSKPRQPFTHSSYRRTVFMLPAQLTDPGIQEIYSRLRQTTRTELIVGDVLEAVLEGGSPLVLTRGRASGRDARTR